MVIPTEDYGFPVWAVYSPTDPSESIFLHKSESEASIHAELLGWDYAEVDAMEVVE